MWYSDYDVPYSITEHLLVQPKQFLGKHYAGWFAIAFLAVVREGIWNLFMGLAKARLLFAKNTLESLKSNN